MYSLLLFNNKYLDLRRSTLFFTNLHLTQKKKLKRKHISKYTLGEHSFVIISLLQ